MRGNPCDKASSVYETQPNNRLLASIAHAFGVAIADYGRQVSYPTASGTLPGL